MISCTSPNPVRHGAIAFFAALALLLASATSAIAQCDIPVDPISHWTGESDYSDSQPAGNNATPDGGSTAGVVQGVIGNGFFFNGIDGIAKTTLPLSTKGTLIFWVQPITLTNQVNGFTGTFSPAISDRFRVNSTGSAQIGGVPANHISVNLGSTGDNEWEISASNLLVVDEWQMMAVTWDYVSQQYSFFVDDISQSSTTGVAETETQPTGGFQFGGYESAPGLPDVTRYSHANMDEIRIFDYALSACQIQQVYDAEAPDGDFDADLILNADDNCVGEINGPNQPSNQLDTDADGYGNACDPDYDQDFAVTPGDFGVFLACFGKNTPFASGQPNDPSCFQSDFDGDGTVTSADSGTIIERIGGAPGPSGLWCAGTIPCQ
jgi:hypothetical protein